MGWWVFPIIGVVGLGILRHVRGFTIVYIVYISISAFATKDSGQLASTDQY
jgi:hypothetical protein